MSWNTIVSWFKVVATAVGGAIGWFIGDMNALLYALVAITVIDLFMSVIRHALVEHDESSRNYGLRTLQKLLIFVLVGAANIIDKQVLGEGAALRTAIILFYLSNEGLSILEHAAALGLPVSDKLIAAFENLYKNDPQRDVAVHEKRKKQTT